MPFLLLPDESKLTTTEHTVWSVQYTANTPQYHQCGFFSAESVQSVDEFCYAVAGMELGEDGKDTLISLFYNRGIYVRC